MNRQGRKIYQVTCDYDESVISLRADYIDYEGEYVILRLMGGEIVGMFYHPESVIFIDIITDDNDPS